MDRPDVFADDADEEELDGGEKEKADHDRRLANWEAIPEDKLVDEVDDGCEEAK